MSACKQCGGTVFPRELSPGRTITEAFCSIGCARDALAATRPAYFEGQSVQVRYSAEAEWQRALYVSHEGENRHTVTLMSGVTGYNISDRHIRPASVPAPVTPAPVSASSHVVSAPDFADRIARQHGPGDSDDSVLSYDDLLAYGAQCAREGYALALGVTS